MVADADVPPINNRLGLPSSSQLLVLYFYLSIYQVVVVSSSCPLVCKEDTVGRCPEESCDPQLVHLVTPLTFSSKSQGSTTSDLTHFRQFGGSKPTGLESIWLHKLHIIHLHGWLDMSAKE
jgi:hypothetical protein